jgi:hypothetical protein
MAKTTGPETHLGSWDVTTAEPASQKRVKRLTSRRVKKAGASLAGHRKKVLGIGSLVLKRAYARIAQLSGPGTDHPGEQRFAPVGEDMEAFFEAQKNAGRASRALLSRQRQY